MWDIMNIIWFYSGLWLFVNVNLKFYNRRSLLVLVFGRKVYKIYRICFVCIFIRKKVLNLKIYVVRDIFLEKWFYRNKVKVWVRCIFNIEIINNFDLEF